MIATSNFELPRDRWKRPLIGGVVYDRPSSLGSTLSDQSNLKKWGEQRVAEGILRNPELLKQGFDVKALAETALEAGGGSAGADFGTRVHELVSRYFLDGEVLDGQ